MSVKYTSFYKYIEKWQKSASFHFQSFLCILRSSLSLYVAFEGMNTFFIL